jgi:hypothetical protein
MTTAAQGSAPHPFTTSLRAFHGDASVQATYLGRVRAHAAADEIVQGQYWDRGKGCAVGCTIHGSSHAVYETELGIPRILARLEDRLFEAMAIADAKGWPERFLVAIPIGADLSLVWPRFAVWMLTDPAAGVIRFAKREQSIAAIREVAAMYERMIAGETVERSEMIAVSERAWAARSAADADADADAAAAAAAYADAAADADADADAAAAAAAYADADADADAAAAAAAYADAAADAAAAAYADAAAAAYADAAAAADADADAGLTARRAFALKCANKLVELLAAAPVPELVAP